MGSILGYLILGSSHLGIFILGTRVGTLLNCTEVRMNGRIGAQRAAIKAERSGPLVDCTKLAVTVQFPQRHGSTSDPIAAQVDRDFGRSKTSRTRLEDGLQLLSSRFSCYLIASAAVWAGTRSDKHA